MALIRSAIGLIITLALAGLAVLNRTPVDITYLPGQEPLTVPLYAVILGGLMIGLLVGGLIIWWIEGKYRRESRRRKKDIAALENELDSVQHKVAAQDPAADLFPAITRKKKA